MAADRWYQVDEMAKYFGIKKETLYKWIAKKDVPAHMVGNLWKFRKDQIDHWVTSGEADSRKRS